MAKNENIPVTFSMAKVQKSQFHSYGIREARRIISTGTPLQFLWQEVTKSVAILHGRDDSPLQVTHSNCQVELTSRPVPFTLLRESGNERVRCLAWEHDTVTLAWAPLWTCWSNVQLTNHWAINSQPPPSPPSPLPSPNIDKKTIVNSAHLWWNLKTICVEFWFNNLNSRIFKVA